MGDEMTTKGSVDYHKRVDFRAMDVFVDAIDNATQQELSTALADAEEWADNSAVTWHRRVIWQRLARLLRGYSLPRDISGANEVQEDESTSSET